MKCVHKIYSLDYFNLFKISGIFLRLATTYLKLGVNDKAVVLLAQGGQIFRKYYQPDHPAMGWVLTEEAKLYQTQEEYKKAQKSLQQGIGINSQYYGLKHIEVGWSLRELAKTKISLGQYKMQKKICFNVLKFT